MIDVMFSTFLIKGINTSINAWFKYQLDVFIHAVQISKTFAWERSNQQQIFKIALE